MTTPIPITDTPEHELFAELCRRGWRMIDRSVDIPAAAGLDVVREVKLTHRAPLWRPEDDHA